MHVIPDLQTQELHNQIGILTNSLVKSKYIPVIYRLEYFFGLNKVLKEELLEKITKIFINVLFERLQVPMSI